jgi:hypothetical protein
MSAIANAAKSEPEEVTSFDKITTVADLLTVLNKLVSNNPDVTKKKLYIVEFGGIVPAWNVSIQDDMLIIDSG